MDVFLGIDGGASHARVAVMDAEGREICEFRGGPLNFYALAEDEVRRHLQAIRTEVEGRLREDQRLAGTVIGSAAVLQEARPGESQRLCQGVLEEGRVHVVSDCLTALYGASSGRPGVLVISGTGSVVVGRDEKGQVHRVGGWGHLFGDEGSAYDIAREALRTAAKKVDAGVGSPLIEGLCRWGAVGEFVDLLPLVYGRDMDKRRLAMLSGFLFEEMRDLPDVAALFAEAADRLVRQVEALLALGTFKEAAPVPLFLVGSVLEKNAMVRDRVLERLAGSGVRGATAQHAPHWGAAIWARERFG